MVRLDRIYTGGGDRGETSLGGGARVAKHDSRIQAIGEVDEANAAIGLARVALAGQAAPLDAILARVQNDLFDLGADLAAPGADGGKDRLRLRPDQAEALEDDIDSINRGLAPLTSFVLPAGTEAASRLHLARTVARRAERAVAALAAREPVNAAPLVYLNRLSDLLFVMARAANDGGTGDVLWRPGGGAGDSGA